MKAYTLSPWQEVDIPEEMQCVILAAGEGKRMRPLTETMPKPLVPVLGKPIIEYVLEALPQEVNEVFIITGYKGDMVRAHLGESHDGRPIRYIHQETPSGTAHALALARPHLNGRFLVLVADDIHGPE